MTMDNKILNGSIYQIIQNKESIRDLVVGDEKLYV